MREGHFGLLRGDEGSGGQTHYFTTVRTTQRSNKHTQGGYAITPLTQRPHPVWQLLIRPLPAGLPQRVRGGQDLAVHDTWSNSQLQALVKAHASLIQDYKCAELGSQDPDAVIHSPAAPAAEQAPQATPLLVPPLNKLAQMAAARALVENAENAQGRGAERGGEG